MNGDLGTAAGRGDLVHLALRLIVEEALEGEVSDVLGRGRYERGEGEKAGYRNGYRPGKMKTAEGAVDYSAPQVRDTPEPFVSSVRAALSGRTRELERLAVELYARGLSTRDIEDTFTDETGRRLLSRAAVSEITEKLWAEYEDFCKRDLSEHAIAYLFVDGIAERLRPGQRREAVLAAWGIGEDGRKSLLGLMAGSREDVETVRAFFQDLRARGLGDPLLVVSDGAPGIIRAIEECFPRSARQRCLAHRMRNLAAKVSADPWPEFKARVTAAIRRLRRRSRVNWRPVSAPITPTLCRARSPVSKTISKPALRTCDCRSPIADLHGQQTSSNGCWSRNDEGSRSCPTASARSRCSSSCSARSSEPRSAGAAYALPSSSSARSPPSERNSTTNIRFQPRHWQRQPSPEFPANPSLDLCHSHERNIHRRVAPRSFRFEAPSCHQQDRDRAP